MMGRCSALGSIAAFWVVALITLGCQQKPPAAPVTVITPTEGPVVVIVTATSQPTLAATDTAEPTSAEPTITLLATLTPISNLGTPTVTPKPTQKATTVPPKAPTKSANTQPTQGATKATPAPSPSPVPTTVPQPTQAALAYPAPEMIGPSGASFREGNDVQVYYRSVGTLASNQCYWVRLELDNPLSKQPSADNFLDTSHCGDASAAGSQLTFTVYRSKFTTNPNYGDVLRRALEPGRPDSLVMYLSVVVVQNNGKSADGVHYNVTPLSPASAPLQNIFYP